MNPPLFGLLPQFFKTVCSDTKRSGLSWKKLALLLYKLYNMLKLKKLLRSRGGFCFCFRLRMSVGADPILTPWGAAKD